MRGFVGGLSFSLIVSGCYLSHQTGDGVEAGVPRDLGTAVETGADGSACAEPGIYAVPLRVESSVPAGCFTLPAATIGIRLPLRAEDFGGMCAHREPNELVQAGPCAWRIHVGCSIPDLSTELTGTLTTDGGAIRGRLTATQMGMVTTCTGVMVLGE